MTISENSSFSQSLSRKVLEMKIGQRVKVVSLADNVADDVKLCLNQVGEICAHSDPISENGYYVRFDDDLPTKRFYENELKQL